MFLSERIIDNKVLAIRPMTSADVDAVAALEQEVQKSPWSRQAFANELGQTHADALVVNCDGQIVAYVMTGQVLDEVHINTLAVIPEWRRMGVATWLLTVLLERARSHGKITALLEVRKCNHQAVRLYQQLGFTIVGERRAYYADPIDDALLMTLNLNEWRYMYGMV